MSLFRCQGYGDRGYFFKVCAFFATRSEKRSTNSGDFAEKMLQPTAFERGSEMKKIREWINN